MVDIVPPAVIPSDADVVDLGGNLVGPSFVDIQVNGGGGVLFNDDTTPNGLRAMAEAHARCGTLAFLPTLMSASPDKMVAAVEAVRAAIKAGVSSVLGLHCEGPYISPPMKGAHDEHVAAAAHRRRDALDPAARPGRAARHHRIARHDLAPSSWRR